MNDKKGHNIVNEIMSNIMNAKRITILGTTKKNSFVRKPDGILVIESSMVGITMQGMQQNRIHAPHTGLMV